MKSGSLSGYDTFPFADFINAKRIVRHRLIAEIAKTNNYQIPCYAGNLGACMFANGDIYPCELLIDRKLGNVRDGGYDFKKIWFGKQADDARTLHPRDQVLLHLRVLPHREHPLQSAHDAEDPEGVGKPEGAGARSGSSQEASRCPPRSPAIRPGTLA